MSRINFYSKLNGVMMILEKRIFKELIKHKNRGLFDVLSWLSLPRNFILFLKKYVDAFWILERNSEKNVKFLKSTFF